MSVSRWLGIAACLDVRCVDSFGNGVNQAINLPLNVGQAVLLMTPARTGFRGGAVSFGGECADKLLNIVRLHQVDSKRVDDEFIHGIPSGAYDIATKTLFAGNRAGEIILANNGHWIAATRAKDFARK